MTVITTRAGKGSPLTNAEVDANFTNLNTGKLEKASNLSDLANTTTARSNLGLGNVNDTSDANKPISTATQLALDGKAPSTHVGATGTAHGVATTLVAGFMSAADKSKLDGVVANANNYSHPAGDGNLHVPATGTTNNGKVLKAGATAGSLSWGTLVKADVGLGNVDNTSDANKPVSAATQTALNAKENTANKGVANGYAGLDATGKVPTAQLPSYVDDVLEYASLSGFPATGEAGKIYVALDTNKTYRWSGSAYIYITSGAVDSVAGKTGVVVLGKADVGLGNVDNTSDANKPVSAAMQAALDLKQDSATASAVPSGAIVHFARNTAPTGWIKANGAALSRTTYAALFAAIGTTFGAGDGSTTFNVPDLRGEFIRSWDDGRGVDTGRGIGTSQNQELKGHTHPFTPYTGTGGGSITAAFMNSSSILGGTTHNLSTGSNTGGETRPRNVAMLACIKF